MKFKKYFKIALILFLSTVIFFGASYLYLYGSLKENQKTAEKNEEDIPYYDHAENCGIIVTLPSNEKIFFYLDFIREMSYIIYVEENIPEDSFGYTLDYTIRIDYLAASMFIDRLGGIDVSNDSEVLRYTGVQICDMAQENNSASFEREILESIFKIISENGISSDDLLFLIKNSQTDLTVPVCFYWHEHLKEVFSNATFVNWEF